MNETGDTQLSEILLPGRTVMNRTKRHFVLGSLAAILVLTTGWQFDLLADVSADSTATLPSSEGKFWVLRLKPGDDLVDSIMAFARQRSIEAGGIVTCVGSLDRSRLRFANQPEYEELSTKGSHFEIISLVGTFSTSDFHLHLAVANEAGDVFGGHAKSGNRVYTTAEVLLVEGVAWEFAREVDVVTTYRELAPKLRSAARSAE